jgi:hypothetical protein
MTTETLIASLTQKLGQEHVITDENELAYYGQDVFSEGNKPLAVIRPGNTNELAETVGMVTEHDIAILPRGGGMSYTSGYLSNRQSVMVGMCRMTDIIEINLEDMYVTVEAGCRWVDLYEALKGKKVKTPMWGTLSGLKASIGGGASQNSVFFGSGQNGAMSDSIIGMEVVTSDGKIVTTGSGAIENGTPFFRHFGPDLTGLFTGDTGALGVKATLTLKLVPDKPEKRFVSFSFEDHYFFKTRHEPLVAMPLPTELEDRFVILENLHSETSYGEQLKDAFDWMYNDATEDNGRIFSLSLHPWVIGQPHRIGILEDFLDYVCQHEGIWFAKPSEIVQVFKK